MKFIYSEKSTKFGEISTVHTDKSKVEISENFVAFLECINFTMETNLSKPTSRGPYCERITWASNHYTLSSYYAISTNAFLTGFLAKVHVNWGFSQSWVIRTTVQVTQISHSIYYKNQNERNAGNRNVYYSVVSIKRTGCNKRTGWSKIFF